MPRTKRGPTSPAYSSELKRTLTESHSPPPPSPDTISEMATFVSQTPLTREDEPVLSLKPSDIKLLAQEVHALMLPPIQEMVTKAVDDFNNTCAAEMNKLKAENESLREESTQLKQRVSVLENMVDDAEQYSRRNCLRIQGLPENTGEDTDALVLELATELGADLSMADLDRTHRLGKPNNPNRAIIVKFTSYRARQRLYSKRKQLRESDKYSTTYINEDLTRKRSKLMFEARKHLKDKLLTGVWSADGSVFIRDKLGNKYRVNNGSDIEVVIAALLP